MPANPKYLTASPWQRAGKITAGILGGYFVTMSLHLAMASWMNHVNVIITSAFTGFIVWGALMVVAFLARSGWKIWLLYAGLTALFSLITWLGKSYNPQFLQ
ncbi:MAG TPA: hypothetical protein VIU12_22255 [Chryseolinea sp.]